MPKKLPDQEQTLLVKSQIIEKLSYSPPKLVKIDLNSTKGQAGGSVDGSGQWS